MSKKKKNGNENRTTNAIILITSIIGLVSAIFEMISRLLKQSARGEIPLHIQYIIKKRICQCKIFIRERK